MSKVIVVTGGSSGIGAALGELLASQGHQVVLVARRQAALEEVASRCGGRGDVQVADVTDRAQVRRVVEETIAKFGRIDVWVNNAGQGITRAPTELTDDDIDTMMRSNVHSALYGMQEVLQLIRDNKWPIVAVIEFEYKVPPGSDRMAEMAKCVEFCKNALLSK